MNYISRQSQSKVNLICPESSFAFALVILKVTHSEMILFHFALISVSMVPTPKLSLFECLPQDLMPLSK